GQYDEIRPVLPAHLAGFGGRVRPPYELGDGLSARGPDVAVDETRAQVLRADAAFGLGIDVPDARGRECARERGRQTPATLEQHRALGPSGRGGAPLTG